MSETRLPRFTERTTRTKHLHAKNIVFGLIGAIVGSSVSDDYDDQDHGENDDDEEEERIQLTIMLIDGKAGNPENCHNKAALTHFSWSAPPTDKSRGWAT